MKTCHCVVCRNPLAFGDQLVCSEHCRQSLSEAERQVDSGPVADADESPFDRQVGGTHYILLAIQPAEYILRNGLGFLEGQVIKYVSRYKTKGGAEDLRKAIHCLEMLLHHMYGDKPKQSAWLVSPKYGGGVKHTGESEAIRG